MKLGIEVSSAPAAAVICTAIVAAAAVIIILGVMHPASLVLVGNAIGALLLGQFSKALAYKPDPYGPPPEPKA